MVDKDSRPEAEALVPVEDEQVAHNKNQTSKQSSGIGRRGFAKMAAGGLIGLGGLGGAFLASSYRGGDAEGSSPSDYEESGSDLNESEDNIFNPPEDEADTSPVDGINETIDDDDTDDDTDIAVDDSTYFLEGNVEIDMDSLDPIMEASDVVLGVQENGDLIAYNEEVEADAGYNPLWRFRADTFPDTEFYDVENPHPMEQLYEDLDGNVEELTEEMVNVFYDEDEDGGSWEDHSEYAEASFEELKEGLIEYGNTGQAQDYFFDRTASLDEDQPVLESEWRELVQDGLEAENGY